MERIFKYLSYGLGLTFYIVIEILSLFIGVYLITVIPECTGWLAIFNIFVAILMFALFLFILYQFGKMFYFGYHLNHKVNPEAPDRELFEAVKKEKFIWNCACEENSIETKENP